MNPYSITALAALPLLFSCWALLRRTPHAVLRFLAILLLVFYVIGLTPFVGGKLDDYTVKKRWQTISRLPLSYSVDSRYQNIAVASLFNQVNLYLNTMPAAVFPNDEDNMLWAAHLICQHPASSSSDAPKRILIIGDAVSGPAKHLLRYNVKKITSVEIDPGAVETVLKFLPKEEKERLLKDKRFELVIEDGRKYVKDVARANASRSPPVHFDLVYLNVPEPSTLLLNRFYTREFFLDLAKIIAPRGVVALKVTASENYARGIVTDYTASIYNTVKSVFPHIVAAPGTQNFIFASADSRSISDDPGVLEERYTNTGVEPQRLGLIFHSLYPSEKTAAAKDALTRNACSRINTDHTPIAGFYFNKIIGWYGKSRVSRVLEFFETVKPTHIVLILSVLFLVRVSVVLFRRKSSPEARKRALRFHILPAVFSAGMAGLALELVILYTFQNNFGNVYSIIGLIIAVFMAGLPLGALAAAAVIKRIQDKQEQDQTTPVIKTVILVLTGIAVIAFLLPYITLIFLPYRLLNQLIVFAAVILIGFAVGFVFPLSIHLYLGKDENTGKTAGIIDAFDHIGAAVGALFIGTLLLPVMGVETVCRLLVLFPLLSALLLISDYIRGR
jgi:spermidine synthase